jgi:hypothetical protein
MMKMKQTLWVLALLMSACCMSLTGCKPSLPDDVLSQGKMEDILYDYHLALAMVQNEGGDETQRFIYKDAVLRKHDVTSAEFDSSMVYYMRHTDKMYTIYKNLSDRLNDEAVSLGADASDQSRFGDLASSGDTTNIWRGAQSLVFMTAKPLNYYNFEVKADTSFHKGDCIMLDFESHFIYQDGIRDGLAVLAVQFSNDSIASQVVHVQSSQHYSMQVEDRDTLGIKSVKGFFLLNSGDFSNDFSSATTLKLMFLDHIRMIKMHKKPVQPVNVSSGDADRFDKDSMSKPGVNTPVEAVKPADESVSPKTVSLYHHGDITLLDRSTVLHEHLHLQGWVETCKHFLGYFHTCQDAIFLDEQMALTHSILWNTAESGMVTVTNILSESQVYQFVF